jgi:hypothetical protein
MLTCISCRSCLIGSGILIIPIVLPWHQYPPHNPHLSRTYPSTRLLTQRETVRGPTSPSDSLPLTLSPQSHHSRPPVDPCIAARTAPVRSQLARPPYAAHREPRRRRGPERRQCLACTRACLHRVILRTHRRHRRLHIATSLLPFPSPSSPPESQTRRLSPLGTSSNTNYANNARSRACSCSSCGSVVTRIFS